MTPALWDVLALVLLLATGGASVIALHLHLQQYEGLEHDALLEVQRTPDAQRYNGE